MSTPIELWKNWEGRVVDGKFTLRQWLGGSDHSAVFLTERGGRQAQKAAIKLISAGNPDAGAQLSGWGDAAKLSQPNLIRLFECGRGQIDDTRLLYVVMEYAEENLAEILPLRALSAGEASEMLRPAAEALASLHRSGFVNSRIRPSNIMAVHDQLKISADAVCRTGERRAARPRSAYDAPEMATTGPSPAADIWSLGATLVAVMTQKEPNAKNIARENIARENVAREPVAVPETIPQPIRDIARQCLQIDPKQRCTASDILARLQPKAARTQAPPAPAPAGNKLVETRPPQDRPKLWIVASIVVVAILLIAWVGSKFMSHQPSVPAAETNSASPANVPATQSPAPFSEKEKPAQKGIVRGGVLQQVAPDVSRNAQNTIEGKLRVVVEVSVDASGNVSGARFVSPGPSVYFANRALAAARGWKFNPPQVNGQAAASVWVLRFQFRRTSIEVLPEEKNP
jgi:TonB family protein